MHVQDFTLPVVRRRGRGGREILRFAAAGSKRSRRTPIDGPAGKAGTVLVVEFTLAGQRFMALNGGKRFEYTHAISFKIDCADQAEVDRLWDKLSSDGGSVERCGWLKDRYGVSWQIVPTALVQYLGGPDPAGAQRAMQAMMQDGQARHRRAEKGL
jgi:predicted 3-demethylubiquinone-9 3-methyltransferase (glyoxalase superfamily)